MLDRGEDQTPTPIEFDFHDGRVYAISTRYPGPDARHMLSICSTVIELLHEHFFSVLVIDLLRYEARGIVGGRFTP